MTTASSAVRRCTAIRAPVSSAWRASMTTIRRICRLSTRPSSTLPISLFSGMTHSLPATTQKSRPIKMATRPDAARGAGNGRWSKDLTAAERAATAAKLRSQGVLWREIAEQLGYASEGAAYEAAQRFWAEQPKQTVAEIRQEFRAK